MIVAGSLMGILSMITVGYEGMWKKVLKEMILKLVPKLAVILNLP